MTQFLLWIILLFLCWPLAIIALILYPVIWLIMLPLRLLGILTTSALEFIKAIFMLPSRILGGGKSAE